MNPLLHAAYAQKKRRDVCTNVAFYSIPSNPTVLSHYECESPQPFGAFSSSEICPSPRIERGICIVE